MSSNRIFSLLEVTASIQKTLAERYQSAFWVRAEMNKLNLHPPSGHCYPELVEKKEGRIIAEIGANLWRDDYKRINEKFLQVLKEPLKNGITILFSARVSYDPVYGLRLRIVDIDPAYSLGELEREKMETIDKLKKEGIFDTNRRRTMPLLPKRLAVISVETSKGYSDFVQTVGNNPWGYRIFHMVFPAILQGERSASSIIAQLRRIKKVLDHFDAVAIIRGGGGEVGLTCYNDHALSREIALFPIPVLTGIGHSTNETVSEMVSYRNSITPTDLADYLIQLFHNYAIPVQQARDLIVDRAARTIRDEKMRLLHAGRYFRSVTQSLLIRKHNDLELVRRSVSQGARQLLWAGRELLARQQARLGERTRQYLTQQARELSHSERTIDLLDPANILKRGYSLSYRDGKLVTSVSDMQAGEKLTTMLADGSLVSVIQNINKDNEQEPGL